MIQFFKNRFIFFGISIALILVGVIAIIVNGVTLDIDFKGGSMIRYSYVGELDKEAAASVASKTIGRDVDIQTATDFSTGGTTAIFSLAGDSGLSSQKQMELDTALTKAFPANKFDLINSSNVEPFIGKRFFRDGLTAIALAFILIIIYVGIRFRRIGGISAGVMAIVALLHDVILVFATFVLFKIPLDESLIAVVLTILGYSINDTIVIYDRIRENTNLFGRKMTVREITDKSINQSLVRSLNTALCTFISMVIVYIFAVVYNIESIKVFALPMIIGIISGSYSTIFIAGPLWVMWKESRKSKKAAAKA